MTENHLEQLFRSCDRKGKGKIGPEEFRQLCAEYNISHEDSVTIFNDLDRDGTGEVTFDDFAWGFRDFLTPGARRVSMQFARATLEPGLESATNVWYQLLTQLGENLPDISCLLTKSGQQLAELHQELQSTEVSPHLVSSFENAIRSLLKDVYSMQEGNKRIENILAKEKEAHLAHLHSLEVELDSQVSHVKAQARAEVLAQCEAEKQAVTSRMKDEINELQTHLKLFHKLNTLLTRNTYQLDNPKNTSDNAVFENLELKNNLAETRTNLALVQSEMAILRSAYEEKCRQLHSHLENVDEFKSQNDHIHHQLSLLQKANIKLQDTNDSLLSSTDGWQMPRTSCRQPGTLDNTQDHGTKRISKSKSRAPFYPMYEMEDSQFKVRRLMEDLDDSGISMQNSSYLGSMEVSMQEELMPFSNTLSFDETDLALPQQIPQPDRSFKIVFAGDAAVGKSCFIHRLCKDLYVNNIGSTLGVDFHVKTIRVDGINVTLQLWDTAGQERFRSMTKTYFRRADGVVLLYDVGSERSFKNVRQWIESVQESTSVMKVPVVLCGNKVDLREDSNQVQPICIDSEQGAKLAREYGAIFLETSSMMGTNVMDSIANLTREMLEFEDLRVKNSALIISEDLNHIKSSACCS